MNGIKVCYLTLGTDNEHGANSPVEFLKLAQDNPLIEAYIITRGERKLFNVSFFKALRKEITLIQNSDIIHYVPRVTHLFQHPIIMLYALFSGKLIMDIRSVNIQIGYRFLFQCAFLQIIANRSFEIAGNFGTPRSFGIGSSYNHIPIGIDSQVTNQKKKFKKIKQYDVNKKNLIYVGTFNKTRKLARFLETFNKYGDHTKLTLHIIGETPRKLKLSTRRLIFLVD